MERVRLSLEDIGTLSQYRASAGKPRTDGTPARPRQTKPRRSRIDHDAIRAAVRPYVEKGTYSREVSEKIAAKHGTSHGIVDSDRDWVEGHLAGLASRPTTPPEAESKPEPEPVTVEAEPEPIPDPVPDNGTTEEAIRLLDLFLALDLSTV